MEIRISNIVTAFDDHAVGTKVLVSVEKFMAVVAVALARHDTGADREPGQHFVNLPHGAAELVSCGEGHHTSRVEDYHVGMHRGEPCVFLNRSNAAKCSGVAAIVYTAEAYRADPQVTSEELAELAEATHVLVAVLGFSDAPPALNSHRFTRNAAGGNNEFLSMSADDLRAKAEEVVAYENNWCTVAD